MNYQAIIFDMDGTLIDSEQYWDEVDRELLVKYVPLGVNLSKILERVTGTSFMGMYKTLKEEIALPLTWEDFCATRIALGIEKVYPRVILMPGAEDCIRRASEIYRTALGTSSPKAFVEATVHRFRVLKRIKTFVSAEDVDWVGKPAPDIFLECARRLGIMPEKCLVIEDSKNGVLSAKAAGMDVWAYRSAMNEAQDLSSADRIFTAYSELALG